MECRLRHGILKSVIRMLQFWICVATSSKPPYHPEVITRLREAGHDVYDFRNPLHGHGGFSWSSVSDYWHQWLCGDFLKGMKSPVANSSYKSDKDALERADVRILVLPCGRSAHPEAGWMSGAGKKVIAYIPEYQESELMCKLSDLVPDNSDRILSFLQ